MQTARELASHIVGLLARRRGAVTSIVFYGILISGCSRETTAPSPAQVPNESFRAITRDITLLKGIADDPTQRAHFAVGASWKEHASIDDVIAQLEADLAAQKRAASGQSPSNRLLAMIPATPRSYVYDYGDAGPDYRVHGSTGMQNTGYLAPQTRSPSFYGHTTCDTSLGSDTVAWGKVTVTGRDQYNRLWFSLFYYIDYVGTFYGSGGTTTTVSGDPLSASSVAKHYCDSGLYGKLWNGTTMGGSV
jgi:hypothetical protein